MRKWLPAFLSRDWAGLPVAFAIGGAGGVLACAGLRVTGGIVLVVGIALAAGARGRVWLDPASCNHAVYTAEREALELAGTAPQPAPENSGVLGARRSKREAAPAPPARAAAEEAPKRPRSSR